MTEARVSREIKSRDSERRGSRKSRPDSKVKKKSKLLNLSLSLSLSLSLFLSLSLSLQPQLAQTKLWTNPRGISFTFYVKHRVGTIGDVLRLNTQGLSHERHTDRSTQRPTHACHASEYVHSRWYRMSAAFDRASPSHLSFPMTPRGQGWLTK